MAIKKVLFNFNIAVNHCIDMTTSLSFSFSVAHIQSKATGTCTTVFSYHNYIQH